MCTCRHDKNTHTHNIDITITQNNVKQNVSEYPKAVMFDNHGVKLDCFAIVLQFVDHWLDAG